MGNISRSNKGPGDWLHCEMSPTQAALVWATQIDYSNPELLGAVFEDLFRKMIFDMRLIAHHLVIGSPQ
jgi:uncharacterized protein (DUF111 family)